jgi:hypothetical protein
MAFYHGRGRPNSYDHIGGENVNGERCRENESNETFA